MARLMPVTAAISLAAHPALCKLHRGVLAKGSMGLWADRHHSSTGFRVHGRLSAAFTPPHRRQPSVPSKHWFIDAASKPASIASL